MRLLLDTQVILWAIEDDRRLGTLARATLTDRGNSAVVSIVSLWEVAIKLRIGKLPGDLDRLIDELPRLSFDVLELSTDHLRQLLLLPKLRDHRDPFDQLLLAQSAAEGRTLLTSDRALAGYGVPILDATA